MVNGRHTRGVSMTRAQRFCAVTNVTLRGPYTSAVYERERPTLFRTLTGIFVRRSFAKFINCSDIPFVPGTVRSKDDEFSNALTNNENLSSRSRRASRLLRTNRRRHRRNNPKRFRIGDGVRISEMYWSKREREMYAKEAVINRNVAKRDER